MIFKSQTPDIEIPGVDLPTFMFSYLHKSTIYGREPNRTAVQDRTGSLSLAELESKTQAFASGLYNKLGVRRGDIVATILPNTSFYPIATMGAQMIGGIVTTANPAYTARELAHQLSVTEARAIVTVQACMSAVKEALQLAGLAIPNNNILTIDGENNVRDVFSAQEFPRVYLTTKDAAQDTPAFIVFSSGTSGKPKGVVLSHTNMVSNALQFLEIDRHDRDLVTALRGKQQRCWLQVLPMFHIYGILISNVSLLTGSLNVIMEKFDFAEFCSLIQSHRVDTVYLAPPIILALTKSPLTKKYDISSLKFINSGAAPLTRELQVEAERSLGVHVTQGYGMSETSPLVSRSLCNSGKPGSAGQICPNTEAIFVDEDGKNVGVGQIGELCVRGPQIMIGYYKNKEATDDAIRSDRFLCTGDIGYIDATGHVFITDRKKELIKYKGFQVAPAELEGLLVDHPDVVDAAVIPIYDRTRATELPKAFVVVRPESKRPGVEKDIIAWAADRVVDYKRLRGGVELIDAIPKSATGKILRRVLKDLEAERLKQTPKL
ncbi:hypothetical protein H4S06_001354 [Coemansia sp. BCRC 34490]|nr:hypothetical protein LPJ72_004552 [Coemansia sp. Benny D160-2]KAJ2761160.1 hypothetical protein H4S06_001354 [Coemansia sp. BCRC 34490]